jgi:hypothetical protein
LTVTEAADYFINKSVNLSINSTFISNWSNIDATPVRKTQIYLNLTDNLGNEYLNNSLIYCNESGPNINFT